MNALQWAAVVILGLSGLLGAVGLVLGLVGIFGGNNELRKVGTSLAWTAAVCLIGLQVAAEWGATH